MINYNISSLEDYFKNYDLNLADLEKLGACLLSLGYFIYINATNLDIQDLLGINTSENSPEDIFLFGQQLVLAGYLVLYIVAVNRLNVNADKNYTNFESMSLLPYVHIALSYLISVFANILRYNAFNELVKS